MSDTRDLIIIGGGPAGYTAALYAARANLQPLVIEGFNWGGQLMITSDVENYPGYPDGIMGPEMMAEFRRQAERFGAEFVTDDVTRVDFSERPFRVWVENEEYRATRGHRRDRRERALARAAVRAAAPGPRRLGLRDVRRRVLPGQGDRRRRRRRLGDGGGGVPHALRDKVTLVHRRDEFRASQIMLDRARANPKIEFVTNAESSRTSSATRRSKAVRLRDTRTGRDVGAEGRRRSSSPSATTRTRRSSSTSSTTTTTATSSRSRARPRRTSPACSRPATCRTTCTARR